MLDNDGDLIGSVFFVSFHRSEEDEEWELSFPLSLGCWSSKLLAKSDHAVETPGRQGYLPDGLSNGGIIFAVFVSQCRLNREKDVARVRSRDFNWRHRYWTVRPGRVRLVFCSERTVYISACLVSPVHPSYHRSYLDRAWPIAPYWIAWWSEEPLLTRNCPFRSGSSSHSTRGDA